MGDVVNIFDARRHVQGQGVTRALRDWEMLTDYQADAAMIAMTNFYRAWFGLPPLTVARPASGGYDDGGKPCDS